MSHPVYESKTVAADSAEVRGREQESRLFEEACASSPTPVSFKGKEKCLRRRKDELARKKTVIN